MKKSNVVLWCICAVLLICSPAWAISLSFNPSVSAGNPGDEFFVDIVISGMENDNLAGFDLMVNYDPLILQFASYTLGSGLGQIPDDAWDWSEGDIGGKIHLIELSLLDNYDLQPDSFTLATLGFIGTSMGTSQLSFSESMLGDERAESLSATFETADVNVTPEPATLLLLSLGFAGLVAKMKLKHKISFR